MENRRRRARARQSAERVATAAIFRAGLPFGGRLPGLWRCPPSALLPQRTKSDACSAGQPPVRQEALAGNGLKRTDRLGQQPGGGRSVARRCGTGPCCFVAAGRWRCASGVFRSSAAAAVMALPPRRMTPDHRTSISGIADPAEARSARMPRGREARGVALPRRGCHDRAVAASVGAGTTPCRRVSPADGSGRTPSGAGLQRRARHRGPTPGGVAGAAARCWSRRATRLRPLSRRRTAPGPCRRPRRHWLEHARGCRVPPGACGWAVQ